MSKREKEGTSMREKGRERERLVGWGGHSYY